MKARALVVLALAALLLAGTLVTVGCGDGTASPEAKAALTAALSDFDLSAGAVTQALAAGSDSTVAADIKAAKTDMKAKWQAVVSTAKAAKWTGADTAEDAWTDVEHAIDSLADNATVDGANAALMPSMDALMSVAGELWTLVLAEE